MKLEPEVKRLWIEALRGDDYKQGNGCLASYSSKADQGVEFCCLGVLLDVVAKAGIVDGGWDNCKNFRATIGEGTVLMTSYPTHHVAPFLIEGSIVFTPNSDGNTYIDPEVRVGKIKKKLSELNDEGLPDRRYKGGTRQFGFKEIANLVEKQL